MTVVNCQNVRRRRCKQTLFTLLLVSNATRIENIAIQFIHKKNTPNATRLYNLSLNSIDLSIPDIIQFDRLCLYLLT